MGHESEASGLFADTYRPVRLPWTYRPVAALVVVLALVQPLVYFGTIAATGWGMWWWLQHGVDLLGIWSRTGGARMSIFVFILKAAAFVTPLVTGVLVILIMLGSLVPAREDRRRKGYVLAPIEQRLLYAYVYRLCDIMKAPRPVRIELIPEANASASFDRGLAWLVRPRLVLSIGTTLVSGMTRHELTGVIAHELGHFTQGVGMRSTRIVSAINDWFVQVVDRRGAPDDVVESMIESEWGVIVLMGILAKVSIGLVRMFVLAVASVSRLATLALSRRMEFAADRCEARVAGSKGYVKASARLIELAEGFGKAIEITRLESVQRRLPDDLTGLAVEVSPSIERDDRGFIKGFRREASVWSTHPSTQERVAAALALDEPGILLNDGPARKLFSDYPALCRDVTRHVHEQVLDGDLAGYKLLSVDALLGREKPLPRAEKPSVESPPPAPVYRKAGERVIEPSQTDDDVIPFADD